MSLTRIERVVRDAIARQLEIDVARVRPSASLREDLEMDPLDLVLVALKLEDVEEIDVPVEGLEAVTTVGDLCRLVAACVDASERDEDPWDGAPVRRPGRGSHVGGP